MGEARRISTNNVDSNAGDPPPILARNWSPPEVIKPGSRKEDYEAASDVWSLALVLTELVTLQLPFGTAPDSHTAEEWYQMLSDENNRPSCSLPQKLASLQHAICKRALTTAKATRITSAQLLEFVDEACELFE